MHPAIPSVEIADNADSLGVRRPNCKARALHAIDAREGARMAERARMARALLQMSDCMASTRAFFED